MNFEKTVQGEKSLLYLMKRLEEAIEKGENDGLTKDDLESDRCYCVSGAYPVKIALDNSDMPNKEETDPEKIIVSAILVSEENEEENFNIEFVYSPCADFNFLLSSTVRHDGTLLFEQEAILNAFNRLINGKFVPKFEGKEEFLVHPEGKKLHYDYGDYVVVNTFDEGTAEKPWMCAKTRVFLPIRIEVQEVEVND